MAVLQSVIMFTDLVNSTKTFTSLGAEEAETLRRSHFATLRAIVELHGGVEVKNLGDGLMLAFSSPSSALACAVALQQGVDAHSRSQDHKLQIRVGISAGELTFEDDDYFGDAVVEAARLCAAADAATIFSSHVVPTLAGRRATQEVTNVGMLALKGLPYELHTVRVEWEPLVLVASTVLPHRLATTPDVRFVGRDSELSVLSESFDRSSSGEGRHLVVVGGEPGIGKTRLCAEMATRAHELGAIVLYGRCDEALSIPYQPFGEAVLQLVEGLDDAQVDALRLQHGRELGRLNSALAQRMALDATGEPIQSDTDRYQLYTAVSRFVAQISQSQPIVMLLDDLHWADTPTLTLLRHLVGANEPMRLLILGTFRDTELNNHPLLDTLASLRREPRTIRIDLRGLKPNELDTLVEAFSPKLHTSDDGMQDPTTTKPTTTKPTTTNATGTATSATATSATATIATNGHSLAQELFRETSGNPFFTCEILRHRAENIAAGLTEGSRNNETDSASTHRVDSRIADTHILRAHMIDANDGGAPAGPSLVLPPSVVEVVLQRVDRLGDTARSVLTMAAVIGNEFDFELLRSTLEQRDNQVLDVLDAGVTSAIIVENENTVGRYRFAHGIYQQSLYESLNRTRRARAHRSVGEALERLMPTIERGRIGELASHWIKAGTMTDPKKAIRHASHAGRVALVALAPDEAARWFTEALTLHELHEFHNQESQEGTEGTEGTEGKEGTEDNLPSRIELLIGLGDAQRQNGNPRYRTVLLEASALAHAANDTEHLVRAVLANNRGLVSRHGMVDEERVKYLREAIELTPGRIPERARLLATLCAEISYGVDRQTRTDLAAEAQGIARESTDLRTLVNVLNLTHDPLSMPGTHESRLRTTLEACELADKLQDPVAKFWAAYWRQFACIEAGDLAQAATCDETCRLLAERLGQPHVLSAVNFHGTFLSLLAGDVDGAEHSAQQALSIAEKTGQPDANLYFSVHMYEIYRHRGDLEAANNVLSELAARPDGRPVNAVKLARLQAEMGELKKAEAFFDESALRHFELREDTVWLLGITNYAELAVRLRKVDSAATLYELLSPFADLVTFPGSSTDGPVATYLGMLSALVHRYGHAEQHFTNGLQIAIKLKAPYWIAFAQLEWARMLRTRNSPGDDERATTLLAQAAEICEAMGFGGLVRLVNHVEARRSSPLATDVHSQ